MQSGGHIVVVGYGFQFPQVKVMVCHRTGIYGFLHLLRQRHKSLDCISVSDLPQQTETTRRRMGSSFDLVAWLRIIRISGSEDEKIEKAHVSLDPCRQIREIHTADTYHGYCTTYV